MFRKNNISIVVGLMIITILLMGCSTSTQSSVSETEVTKDKETNVDDNNQVIDKNESLQIESKEGILKLHFIDVGQGNSTFIVAPDGQTMLYDAGGDDTSSGRIVVDYIKSIGYDYIDVAIFSHPHADHINGATTVFEELKVKSVYYPKVTHTTRTFENFVEAVKKAGLKFKTAKAGVEIPFGEVSATLVAPLSDKYDNLNDYSTTIKLVWGNTSVLLTGDVEETSENEMINSTQDLDIDLLLVPHHGSNSSTTDEFLDKTTPKYAIISAGKDNSYGHPHKEVMDRLNERNIKVYNTTELETIVAALDGQKVYINGEVEENANNELNNDTYAKNSNTKEENIEKLDIEVSIDETKPKQNSDITITVNVTSNGNPVKGANISVLNHYKSTKTSYDGITDENGIAEISYGIGRASVDFEVKVEVLATKENIEAKAETAFVPQ